MTESNNYTAHERMPVTAVPTAMDALVDEKFRLIVYQRRIMQANQDVLTVRKSQHRSSYLLLDQRRSLE